MTLSQQIQAFLLDGYFAQGVALLRQCPGVSLPQVRQFEAYLGRAYVPGEVEQRLASVLRHFVSETGNETGGNSETARQKQAFSVDAPVQAGWEAHERKFTPIQADVGSRTVSIRGAVSGTFWGALFAGKTTVPAEIWQLYERAIGLHKRQAHVHPLMCQAATEGKQKEVFVMAQEIMEDITQALDGIYDAARAWGETGKIPAANQRDDVVRQTVEKMKRIEYCKQRVSRIRGWLKAGERVMTVDGKKQVVRLDLKDVQELEGEVLERQVEEKGLREELGIDE